MAKERSRRPSDFRAERAEKSSRERCPFCPGNEEMTPPATAVYRDGEVLRDGDGSGAGPGGGRVRNWQIRCIPNLFPAVSADPGVPTAEWVALPGAGSHEVIIESPDHEKDPSRFEGPEMELMLTAYRDRYLQKVKAGAAYVSIFKNWGRAAGASLGHTHTQLVALPLVPPLLMREARTMASAPFCPYCNVVEREAASERLVAENEGWVLLAPFCAQTPYETWILPKAHVSNLGELGEGLLAGLAEILGEATGRLAALLDDPPYNYMIYQLSGGYHLNIRVQPVTSKIAGFEKNTGIFINTVPPEQAASELRDAEI